MFRLSLLLRALLALVPAIVGLLLSNCRSANYASVGHRRVGYEESVALERSVLPPKDTLPRVSRQTDYPTKAEQLSGSYAIQSSSAYHPQAAHVSNPEAPKPGKKQWLQKLTVASTPPTLEYAPRHETPILTIKRKVPGLTKASIAGGIISHFLLLFGTTATAVWLVSILVPLAATLIGIAGLAKITRRREEFRGKGWAMSAIVLATGALGLALVAVAALATSETIWK